MTARRLAALVVTRNRLPQLRVTVARLLAEPVALVLVVDNASDDDTATWLADQTDPRLRVLSLAQNTGGAGGFAAGLAHLRQLGGFDWLVTMDDDARPEPGTLASAGVMDLTEWDAVAAAVYYPDGALCEMNRPIVNRLSGRAFLPTHFNAKDYAGTEARPITASSFVGLFISKETLDAVPLPDPSLFLYMDDGLFTLGISQGGRQLGFAPTLRFEHDCRTLATGMTGFRPLWKVYYYHRNMLIFYRASMGALAWPALIFLLPRWIAKVRDQPGEKVTYLRLLARATLDGLRNRRGIRVPPR